MADIIAYVENSPAVSATVADTNLTLATSYLANPSILESMSDIGDVDTTILQNGSVLVYKTTTNK